MSTSWPRSALAGLIALIACSCEAFQLASSASLRRPCAHRAPALRMELPAALGNTVVVELTTEPATSAGGVFLPTAFDKEETVGGFQRKKINSGTVVGVGPGLTLQDGSVLPISGVSVGQIVVLEPNAEGEKVYPEDSDSQVFIYPHRCWSEVLAEHTHAAGRLSPQFPPTPPTPATDRDHVFMRCAGCPPFTLSHELYMSAGSSLDGTQNRSRVETDSS